MVRSVSKGQSSSEFLVIFAAVLVIALISAAMIRQASSSTAQVRYIQSKILLSTQKPLAIPDAQAQNGAIALLAKNTGDKMIVVSVITLTPQGGEPQTLALLPESGQSLPSYAIEILVPLALLAGLVAFGLSSLKKREEKEKIKSQEEHLADVRTFIENSQAEGHDREFIASQLLAEGWDRHVIDEAFDEVAKKGQPPS